jgi:hypothetical protein
LHSALNYLSFKALQKDWEAKLSIPSPNEFYRRFRDDPEAAQQEAFKRGEAIGRAYIKEHNINGDDIQAVAKVLNAFGQQTSTFTRVQGKKAIVSNRGFCPIMASAMSFNIPWKWLCRNYGWPLIRGIASAVNPKAKVNVGSWRADGDQFCEHIYEIE